MRSILLGKEMKVRRSFFFDFIPQLINFSDLSINKRLYHFLIGFLLLCGIISHYLSLKYLPHDIIFGFYLIIYPLSIISMLLGICIYEFSDQPIKSFAGFLIELASINLIIRLLIVDDIADFVFVIIKILFLMTALMMVLNIFFPSLFSSLWRALFILCVLMTVIVVIDISTNLFNNEIAAMAIAFLISLIIGYGWNYASKAAPSLDGSIDCAAYIYMNVFLYFISRLRTVKGTSGGGTFGGGGSSSEY